jgi:putative ABC transport system substrate-binding protein
MVTSNTVWAKPPKGGATAICIRRRELIVTLGGAAASWPFAARAQQPAMPVVGILQIGAPGSWDFTGFRQGLKETGYVEGQNLAIEYRWANDDPDRLAEPAADLVRRQVRVIVALGNTSAVQAAKAATQTIPVVFGMGSDPVQMGLVASLSRPGGNVTGMTSLSTELFGKQLGILRDLLPNATELAVLTNPKGPTHEIVIKESQAAASVIGVTIEVLTGSSRDEIDEVFARLGTERHVQGLLISNDPLFLAARVQLAILAARFVTPAVYPFREQAEAGGLLSYGPDLVDRDRQVGRYVSRILKGERPADLPVLQESKFEFIINLRTAKALGLTISNSMQLLADRVIE